MIPKIIHYCWFGPKEMPELEKRCVESWRKFLPDWELRLWNEHTVNFDEAPLFASQALEHKKWAFVSDCVRVMALYRYGGLYLDPDVELLPPMDALLASGNNIMGFEVRKHVGTAFMAFHPGHQLMREYLRYYECHPFVDSRGRMDVTANVSMLTDLLIDMGLRVGGDTQQVGDITVFRREVFYPKKHSPTEYSITPQTLAVHRCSNSWMSEGQRKRGSNWFWLHIVRPIFQNGRAIGTRLIGKEHIRNIEIAIRGILK